MRLFTTPMDGKAWKCKDSRFREFEAPEEFYLKYAKYAIANDLDNQTEKIEDIKGEAFKYHEVDKMRDNGFYVGKDVMSDSQFKKAFIFASQAMQQIYANGQNQYWEDLHKTKKGRERLSKMMQIAVQGFISVGAIINLQQDSKDSIFSQACKQDIDRGVVLNVITKLFYKLLANESITQKDVQLIIGSVIARAKLVEDRIIIFRRFQPLSDLLHFIGENQDMVKDALKAYSKQIKSDKLKKMSYVTQAASFLNPSSDSFSIKTVD